MSKVKERYFCEVCSAGATGVDDQIALYKFGGSIYCEEDLDRAITEGWNSNAKKITEIENKEDKANG